MSLTCKGLVKLTEECGELIQIASKKMSYMDTDDHPDGNGSMAERLEKKMGDVYAATVVVTENFGLSWDNIINRSVEKRILFRKWHKGEE